MKVLTLCWDPEEGEARINFEGMNKLHGIEKADFLDDCIRMLLAHNEEMGNSFFEDYRK